MRPGSAVRPRLLTIAVLLGVAFASATPAYADISPAVPNGGGTAHAGAIPGRAVATASGPPAGYSVTGIDVSSYQGNVNWSSVAAAGAKFAYVKATEGTTYTNPYFSQQYGGAKTVGLYAGAYAFARPDANDPVQQADYLVANAQFARDGQTLPLMLDLEGPYFSGPNLCWNLSTSAMISWIRAFVNEEKAKTGRPMLIYTSYNWWKTCTGNSAAFSDQLLDIANWSGTPTPLPASWTAWKFWQYAASGTLPGDQDVFNGTIDHLAALASGGPPATPTLLSVAPTATGVMVGVRLSAPWGLASTVTVTASPGGATGSAAPDSAGDAFVTVPGLQPRTAYTFTASATGAGGASASSPPSGQVIPGAGSGTGDFVPVGPVRSYDFRSPGSSALGPGQTRNVQVAGVAGVPAGGVAAVALAVSVVNPSSSGYVTVWPAGQSQPLATTVNFIAGQTKTDLTKVPVGTGGQVSIYNFAGTTGFTFDVVGFYLDGSGTFTHNVSFATTTPYRLFDTRPGVDKIAGHAVQGGAGPLTGGQQVAVQVTGSSGDPDVPAGATAVELNVEGINPSAAGYLTVWADGAPRPIVSNVLYGSGSTGTIVTSLIAPIGPDGKIDLFANTTTDLAVDVNGYYSATASGRFVAVSPARVYDSRTHSAPLTQGETREIPIAGVNVSGAGVVVPTTATSVVFAATAVDNTGPTYLTVWPQGVQPRPIAANLLPSRPSTLTDNLVVSGLAGNAVDVYNNTGSTDLVIDVDGYYTSTTG